MYSCNCISNCVFATKNNNAQKIESRISSDKIECESNNKTIGDMDVDVDTDTGTWAMFIFQFSSANLTENVQKSSAR